MGNLAQGQCVLVNMYEGRLKIAKMEDYKFDTFKKEIKFTPATNTDVVASKLLSPQEINKIAKPITLHGIA